MNSDSYSENIPIAYEIHELPKLNDINIAIVDGQEYERAIVVGFRSRIDKLKEKYLHYITFLVVFGMVIFAYVVIIMILHN